MARILIVDDDRSIRRTLEKFLGGEGYEVATAHDAPGAIAAADASDVMLLDLRGARAHVRAGR
ncbi:MAG TPA: response regulator [Kofleriaceae bacterium]|nr:response regulator [Kofleriaceae bacterium]